MSTPIERAKAAAEAIEAHREGMAEARAERRAAMTEARETMSAEAIGQALGISKARVYRILSGKET